MNVHANHIIRKDFILAYYKKYMNFELILRLLWLIIVDAQVLPCIIMYGPLD